MLQRLHLLDLIFVPSLVVFFDNYNLEAIKEAADLDIPSAGIVDTNSSHFNTLLNRIT